MSKYMTRQRGVLLSYLSAHTDELLSAQTIGDALAAEAVSLSSVYRNLADLEAEGKVRRSTKGSAREIYYLYIGAETCRGCLHMSCTRCGRTFHMGAQGAEQLAAVISDTEGFALDKGETVLYGVCGTCQKCVSVV